MTGLRSNGMKSFSLSTILVVFAAGCFVSGNAWAGSSSPGLSMFSGVSLSSRKSGDEDRRWGHNFGFFVDLPIISTFHICPSAEMYDLDETSMTDIAIAFKFVIPMGGLKPYIALVPGITSVGNEREGHLGAAGGVYWHLVSNLHLALQAKYKETLSSGSGVRVIHANGGLLFRF